MNAARAKPIRHTHTAVVLLCGFAIWLFLGLVPLHLLHNLAIAEAWFFIGAALVPGTLLWIMTHRLTATDTLKPAKLVQTAAVGGVLAFTLGGTLDSLAMHIPQQVVDGEGVVSLALAGVIEEFAKAVIVVVLGWKVAKTARNGLFLGGAVGIGFAILETMYYLAAAFQGTEPVLETSRLMFERGLLSPFMHPLWSALLAAAIFAAAAKSGRFRLTFGIVGAYLGVAVLHGLWDSGGPLVGIALGNAGIGVVASIVFTIVAAVVGGLVWRHVAKRCPAPAPVEVFQEATPSEVPKAAPAPTEF